MSPDGLPSGPRSVTRDVRRSMATVGPCHCAPFSPKRRTVYVIQDEVMCPATLIYNPQCGDQRSSSQKSQHGTEVVILSCLYVYHDLLHLLFCLLRLC